MVHLIALSAERVRTKTRSEQLLVSCALLVHAIPLLANLSALHVPLAVFRIKSALLTARYAALAVSRIKSDPSTVNRAPSEALLERRVRPVVYHVMKGPIRMQLALPAVRVVLLNPSGPFLE
jgi:hypothetical protein